MGVRPPFMYDAIRTEGPKSPYKEFDPKAVTRASYEPRSPRRKHEGPMVSFNQHPDSHIVMPYPTTTATPMNPSVKKWIKWMRLIQLVLRCFELLAALGLLVVMIMIKGLEESTGWIMRIVPGIAVFHTVYGVYHLARRASGRTPASSTYYMLFASFFDVSIIPFYAFSALVSKTRQDNWRTILSNNALIDPFTQVVFYLATIGGGLHLISLAVGIYLAVTFRRITQLPPDMNPLEDNLTSRHKRNKSSVSTFASSSTMSEKRLSTPLEAKRASGAPYEDLSRPPTIPFFHTRDQSSTSFSTYKASPPPSRDSRADLTSRQYQAVPTTLSPTRVDNPKRASQTTFTSPPKRTHNPHSATESLSAISFNATFLPPKQVASKSPAFNVSFSPPKHTSPVLTGQPAPFSSPPRRDSFTENQVFDASSSLYSSRAHINDNDDDDDDDDDDDENENENDNSGLNWFASDSLSKACTRSSPAKKAKYQALHHHHDCASENITFDAATVYSSSYDHPNPLEANPPTPVHRYRDGDSDDAGAPRSSGDMDIADIPMSARDRELVPRPLSQSLGPSAKRYGELKPGPSPMLVGSNKDRQVSSGNDLGDGRASFRVLDRRDVSGKVAEEGRGGPSEWRARLRRVSGIAR